MGIQEGKFDLRVETMRMYDEYVAENGEEPEFALCEVQFKDEDCSLMANIKLSCSCDENSEEDDNTFFYCNGIRNLCSMIEEGVEDWMLIDVYEFS